MSAPPLRALRELLRRRLVRPVVDQLTQGLSASSIALTLALGLCLGVIPVLGTTTVLCAAAAVVLRLNQPLIQAVNYVAFPLQIALVVPFLTLGHHLFGEAGPALTAEQLAGLAAGPPLEAVRALGGAALQATAAWLLTAPVAGLVVFLVARPLLAAAGRQLRRNAPSAPPRTE